MNSNRTSKYSSKLNHLQSHQILAFEKPTYNLSKCAFSFHTCFTIVKMFFFRDLFIPYFQVQTKHFSQHFVAWFSAEDAEEKRKNRHKE